MCPRFICTFSQQRATTNSAFTGTRFHWPWFFWDLTPFTLFCLQPLQFPADKAFINAHLSKQKHAAKKNIQACKAKGQTPSWGPSIAIGRNTPGGAAAKLSQSGIARHAPAELLQARGQVWRTTWLIFLLWMRTALPAWCFLHDTEAYYNVLHHS